LIRGTSVAYLGLGCQGLFPLHRMRVLADVHFQIPTVDINDVHV
jgi:hypothetical protein